MSNSRSRARRPRPVPKGDALFTPDASPARQNVERKSATSVLWLHQLPAWWLPVAAAGLLVAGLAMHGLGSGIALAGLAAVLIWLAALSWPRLPVQGRLLRIAAVTAILAAAVLRALR
ncbi:MAG TPA: DUF6703 family protein [Streptosporangiaceae bacterium]|nr:DUF6703 family protein [Streptosporangiaceae bacterium]